MKHFIYHFTTIILLWVKKNFVMDNNNYLVMDENNFVMDQKEFCHGSK